MHRRGLFLESVDQVKIMLNAGKMYSESSHNVIQDLGNNSLGKLSSMDSFVAIFDYF